MRMSWIIWAVIGLVVLAALAYGVEIVVANRTAARDYGPDHCWLVQEDAPRNLPELVRGPDGFLVPNPFRQLNRAVFGFGLDEPGVKAPHFAVAYKDAEGATRIAAWSYRRMGYWDEPQDLLQRFVGRLDLSDCG